MDKKMASNRAVLRVAKESDAGTVLKFYEDNRHDNVLGRAGQVQLACEQGWQVLTETAEKIIAVAGAYPTGNAGYIEVGGARVADSSSGFRLQDLLFWVRFAAIALNSDPSVRITTAVDPSNSAGEQSQKAILRQGFEDWHKPVDELLVECDPGPNRSGCAKKAKGLLGAGPCCSKFYLLPIEALQARIRDLLDYTANSLTIDRPGKAGTLSIEFQCKFLSEPEFRAVLDDFSRGIV